MKEPDKPLKSDRLLIDIESRKKKRKKVSSEAAKSSSQSGSKSVSSGGSGGDKLHTEDQKKIKRRRFYTSIMKREIGKAQKARNFNQVHTGSTILLYYHLLLRREYDNFY